MKVDLEAIIAGDGTEASLENLYSNGGPLPALLARLGAYQFHPFDGSCYHDFRGVGWPVYRMRKDRVPFDPTLSFDEYAMLVPCGPRVRALIAAHPSTPPDVVLRMKTMGGENELLDVTQIRQAPLPPIEDTRPPPPKRTIDAAKLAHVLGVCAAKGSRDALAGPEATLVRRAGGFDYAYEVADGTEEWNDWNGAPVGSGSRFVTRPAEALDPTLTFDELTILLDHGAYACGLVARHPRAPASMRAKLGVP